MISKRNLGLGLAALLAVSTPSLDSNSQARASYGPNNIYYATINSSETNGPSTNSENPGNPIAVGCAALAAIGSIGLGYMCFIYFQDRKKRIK